MKLRKLFVGLATLVAMVACESKSTVHIHIEGDDAVPSWYSLSSGESYSGDYSFSNYSSSVSSNSSSSSISYIGTPRDTMIVDTRFGSTAGDSFDFQLEEYGDLIFTVSKTETYNYLFVKVDNATLVNMTGYELLALYASDFNGDGYRDLAVEVYENNEKKHQLFAIDLTSGNYLFYKIEESSYGTGYFTLLYPGGGGALETRLGIDVHSRSIETFADHGHFVYTELTGVTVEWENYYYIDKLELFDLLMFDHNVSTSVGKNSDGYYRIDNNEKYYLYIKIKKSFGTKYPNINCVKLYTKEEENLGFTLNDDPSYVTHDLENDLILYNFKFTGTGSGKVTVYVGFYKLDLLFTHVA